MRKVRSKIVILRPAIASPARMSSSSAMTTTPWATSMRPMPLLPPHPLLALRPDRPLPPRVGGRLGPPSSLLAQTLRLSSPVFLNFSWNFVVLCLALSPHTSVCWQELWLRALALLMRGLRPTAVYVGSVTFFRCLFRFSPLRRCRGATALLRACQADSERVQLGSW